MKKIFLLAAMFGIAFTTTAQTLDYNQVGLLFSQEKINGTARVNGMSGAFGSLGADVSAISINPAGAAVFLNSEVAASLSFDNIETTSTYYDTTEMTENDMTDISQAGGVFVFNSFSNGRNKVALAINYSKVNDFENYWYASGNSGAAPFTDFYDTTLMYPYTDGQDLENATDGQHRKYSFTVASQSSDNLYLGLTLNSHDIEYIQRVLINEYNSDDNGDTFDLSLLQELYTIADGVSFNLGLIAKPTDELRLGLAYQSPTWYTVAEDFIDDGVEIYESSQGGIVIDEDYQSNAFDYKLRTPSHLTGSLAYIFNRQGLFSLDYTYKNYSNIEYRDNGFEYENEYAENQYRSVGALRLGTEWRFDKLSVRGGYHFEKSPYKDSLDSDNIEGFSLGAGFKFKFGKIDLSYQKYENTDFYNFYPDYNVDAAELNYNNSKVTATLVLNI